jgi:hypothetical protein
MRASSILLEALAPDVGAFSEELVNLAAIVFPR